VLEVLESEHVALEVHRFANLSYTAQFAQKKGLTMKEVADVIAFDKQDVAKELLENPFKRKPKLANKYGPRSRFSDGEWPVFYSAVGRTTAQLESAHHYGRKAAGDREARRGVYYSIVRCNFAGRVIDLQPKLLEWPNLVAEDYAFCVQLGLEAQTLRLDGFLGPSARNPGGVTVPAFVATTLSNPAIEATAKLTFDAATNVAGLPSGLSATSQQSSAPIQLPPRPMIWS
jgi:hypothetical protein